MGEFDVAPPTPPESDDFQVDPEFDIAPPPPPDMLPLVVPAPGTPKKRKSQEVAPPTAEKPKSPAHRMRAPNSLDPRLAASAIKPASSERWRDGQWQLAISARDGGDSFLDAKDVIRQDHLLSRLEFICPVVASVETFEPQTPREKRQKLEFSHLVDQVTTGRQSLLQRSGSLKMRSSGSSLGVDRVAANMLRSKSRESFFEKGNTQIEAELQ